MKSKKTMFVNPVLRHSYQGRHNQNYIIKDPKTGEQIKSKPLNRSQTSSATTTLSFNIDKNRNKLVTGLDEVITNPLFGKIPQEVTSKYSLSSEWDLKLINIVKAEEITLQTLFEIEAGVNPDFYTSNVKGDMLRLGVSDNQPDLTFLQTFKVILYPRPNRFTTETPRGKLAMQLLKYQRYVAKNIDSANNAIHLFYISEENEAQERALARKKLLAKAHYSIVKLEQEYTAYDRYKAAVLLKNKDGRSLVKSKVSDLAVMESLYNYVDSKDTEQLTNIKKLIKTVEEMGRVETNEQLNIEFIVQSAINCNIIIARDGEVIWHKKRDQENVGSFSSIDKLKQFILKEYESYSPKGKETNYYKELLTELQDKNAWVE